MLTLHLAPSHNTGKSPSIIACLTLVALWTMPQSVHEAAAKVPWASMSFVSGISATEEGKNVKWVSIAEIGICGV